MFLPGPLPDKHADRLVDPTSACVVIRGDIVEISRVNNSIRRVCVV